MLIPGGCTKYIQALDLSWNIPFKGVVTELCDKWLANGVQDYTEQRNLKPPPRKLIVEWIVDAWNKLSGDIIKKLFKAYALILTSMDQRILVYIVLNRINPVQLVMKSFNDNCVC